MFKISIFLYKRHTLLHKITCEALSFPHLLVCEIVCQSAGVRVFHYNFTHSIYEYELKYVTI